MDRDTDLGHRGWDFPSFSEVLERKRRIRTSKSLVFELKMPWRTSTSVDFSWRLPRTT